MNRWVHGFWTIQNKIRTFICLVWLKNVLEIPYKNCLSRQQHCIVKIVAIKTTHAHTHTNKQIEEEKRATTTKTMTIRVCCSDKMTSDEIYLKFDMQCDFILWTIHWDRQVVIRPWPSLFCSILCVFIYNFMPFFPLICLDCEYNETIS